MATYKVVLEIDTDKGDPAGWNWEELLEGDSVALWEVTEL